MSMDVKGYIFDYGGTLDTAGCHWGKMLWHAYERQHLPVTEEQFRDVYVQVEKLLGRGRNITQEYTFYKTLDTKINLELECFQKQGYINEGNFSLAHLQTAVLEDLYQEVQETTKKSVAVLKEIKKSHPMVLVSNFYGNINVVLKEFGFDGLFDHVIESAAVGIRKPDPRIFQLGVEALKMEPRMVAVVGDSIRNDIIPAAELGCQTIWLKGEGWTTATDGSPIKHGLIVCRHRRQTTARGDECAGRIITSLDELLQ